MERLIAHRRDAECAERMRLAERKKPGICFSLRKLCVLRASAVRTWWLVNRSG
jgi:hypothetical protein